jgi:hypothetical protein
MRSRGAEGNCKLGPELATAVLDPGQSIAVAAVAADFARKCLRVVGAKAAPVQQNELGCAMKRVI